MQDLNGEQKLTKEYLWSVLDRAVSAGFVQAPQLEPIPWEPPKVAPDIIAQLAREPKQKIFLDVDTTSNPANAPESIEYQENMNGPHEGYWVKGQDYKGAPFTFAADTSYELARFKTRPGEFGIIRLLWTFLECIGCGGGNGDSPANPLSPRAFLDLNYNCFFYLRSSNYTPPISLEPLAPRPGWPMFPAGLGLNLWRDYRFAWGLPVNLVFLVVPPDTNVHLFFNSGNKDEVDVVGVRLQGYTQPRLRKDVAENAKHGWNW